MKQCMQLLLSEFLGSVFAAALLIYLMMVHGGYLFIYLIIIFYIIYFLVLVLRGASKKYRAKHPYFLIKIMVWLLLFSSVYLFQDIKLSTMEKKANQIVSIITTYSDQYGHYPSKDELRAQSEIFKNYDDRKIMFYALPSANDSTFVSFMYKSPLNPFDRYYLNDDMKTWKLLID